MPELNRPFLIGLMRRIEDKEIDVHSGAEQILTLARKSHQLAQLLDMFDQELSPTASDFDGYLKRFEGNTQTEKKNTAALSLQTSVRKLERYLNGQGGGNVAHIVLDYPDAVKRSLRQEIQALLAAQPRPQSTHNRSTATRNIAAQLEPTAMAEQDNSYTTEFINAEFLETHQGQISKLTTQFGSGDKQNGIKYLLVINLEGNILAQDSALEGGGASRESLLKFINSKAFLDTLQSAGNLREWLHDGVFSNAKYRAIIHSLDSWVIVSNVCGPTSREVAIVSILKSDDFRYGQHRNAMDLFFKELRDLP